MPILIDIADKHATALQLTLAGVFEAVRGRIPAGKLAQAIEEQGVDGVLALLRGMDDDFAPFVNRLDRIIQESGAATVSMIPAAAVLNPRFRFDIFSDTSTNFIRGYRFNLIRQISDETREVVRQTLVHSAKAGTNPRTAARRLRETIGLTSR